MHFNHVHPERVSAQELQSAEKAFQYLLGPFAVEFEQKEGKVRLTSTSRAIRMVIIILCCVIITTSRILFGDSMNM
jgi:hypothetical protein